MNITIPVYVEQVVQENAAPFYAARPLFFEQPAARHEELSRALAKLTRELRRALAELGNRARHDELAAYSFAPDVSESLLDLKLDLGKQTVKCRLLVASFAAFGRRVAFSPTLPDVWFDVARGESLAARAAEVFTHHFREQLKKERDGTPNPEQLSVKGKAWATTVEVEVQPPQVAKKPAESLFASLGGAEAADGAEELHNVGRCLDWLYPDELRRVLCRDAEVAELARLLGAKDRRPVLLAGPRLVGKTAIVEEYIYQVVARRRAKGAGKGQVWLLAPQRLISGMSYVGQWENRLLAILKEAKERDHVLYFDDLLGLFRAGQSASSNLSVAHVLRPYLERREVRVVGEIMPEALRVLRELDRPFADLFHVLPVREPNEDETLRMLLGLIRQLESQHRCRFALDALPAAIDLQRRYVRDAAFPGKAAAFLTQLAVKFRRADIARGEVLAEFQAKSGLSVAFLDQGTKLDRQSVIDALGKEVIGQPGAVEAAADVVCIAKARLNDPDRPLASFLFLGPTGVGKTQSAKSLAAYLFGDAERLVRFDMNEFVSPASVARLVGTFDQPEGLLTSAVRRQPFSVVLLDEIEKAHPDVFNLLLQVMGDGRLTDAVGRTTDFTNAILILTSNLGVKEASAELGFVTERSQEASVYLQAAEKFFSPEFFNRLDRVVPFARLRREDIAGIARKLIQDVFAREGLRRRRCVLDVDERAMEKLVDAGYHPQLGARALKRAVERQLTAPVAARLAALAPDSPTVISLYPTAEGFTVHVQELCEAEPNARDDLTRLLADPADTLDRLEEFLSRVEEECDRLRPAGAISIDDVRPEHQHYFALREQLQYLRRLSDGVARQLQSAARSSPRALRPYPRKQTRPHTLKRVRSWGAKGERQVWKQLFAAEDIHAYFQELGVAEPEEDGAPAAAQLTEAVYAAAHLNVLARGPARETDRQALLWFRPLGKPRRWWGTPEWYDLRWLGWELAGLDGREDAALVSGWRAYDLLRAEQGTYLHIGGEGEISPVQLRVFAVRDADEARAVIDAQLSRRRRWLELLSAGQATVDEDPFKLEPVVRVYNHRGGLIDWRTGLLSAEPPSPRERRAVLLAALPLPPELIE
jgi:ATP-dependent Clp protease ATP-binding subunit ClpC